jgi:hypothetical protein
VRPDPGFIIVGGHKCASTSLHAMLAAHPAILMSAVKEPHYLAAGALEHRLQSGVWNTTDYFNLWSPNGPEKLTGEASALYLYYAAEVLASIQRELPRAPKIVVSVRNPIDRALSSFRDVRLKNPGESARTFEEAITREIERGPRSLAGSGSPTMRHLALGFYSAGIDQFRSALGTSQVHVVLVDDLKSKRDTTMQEIHAFLGVTPMSQTQVAPRNVGGVQWRGGPVSLVARSGSAMHLRRRIGAVAPRLHRRVSDLALSRFTEPGADMSATMAGKLGDFYRGEIEALESSLGRDLSHWYGRAS